jgi:RNA-binding protein
MLSLTPTERRALRARAHRLHPVVRVGQQGLTTSVLHEIDVNLLAHELIKVRVFSADHVAREELLARICTELEAAPVQHIGKLLVVWRPAPPPPAAPARTPKSSRGRKSPAAPAPRQRERVRDAPPRVRTPGLAAAKSKPQARRPREPAPRAPSRPPAVPARRPRGGSQPGSGRRRGRGGQSA